MITKVILILSILTLTFLDIVGQEKECDCIELDLSDENKFKCDTTFFENGAFMYLQLNCDSTWLTFENKQKVILKSCEKEMILECGRSGLFFLKEYPNYLLFVFEWISGCCTTPDLVFISKQNGLEIKRISKDLFVWGDNDLDYSLYFSDTTYTKLIYRNHITDIEYLYNFDEYLVVESAVENNVMSYDKLFVNFIIDNDKFKFDFLKPDKKIEKISIQIK
ncbi:MAG: hypothetical protein CVV25_08215 [Ignavibacteriae bacterium HGW-Ignavibacteriae-4]|jgi:hypothetical protein|nr:MAG: hypothetical protein CVV25_08215 [Ignavibacteriae bacterium HGW-Ignavibacteriae-4]